MNKKKTKKASKPKKTEPKYVVKKTLDEVTHDISMVLWELDGLATGKTKSEDKRDVFKKLPAYEESMEEILNFLFDSDINIYNRLLQRHQNFLKTIYNTVSNYIDEQIKFIVAEIEMDYLKEFKDAKIEHIIPTRSNDFEEISAKIYDDE